MSVPTRLTSFFLIAALAVGLVSCADSETESTAPDSPEATATLDENAEATVTAISATADAAARAVGATGTAGAEESGRQTATLPGPGPTASPTDPPTATSAPSPTDTPAPPTATEVPPTPTPEPPTPTPEPPTATPEPEFFSFGEGVQIVGQDIPPGTYRSTGPDGGILSSCYWERLAGFSGQLEDVIANEFADYRQVVTIKEGDAGFDSNGCGQWTADLGPITEDPAAPFGDGVWIVNVDIAPGTWRSESPPDGSCYWERLSGFGGELEDIISNEFTDTQQIVTIAPSDTGFTASGCGAWTRIEG